jgi:hypothetical protein
MEGIIMVASERVVMSHISTCFCFIVFHFVYFNFYWLHVKEMVIGTIRTEIFYVDSQYQASSKYVGYFCRLARGQTDRYNSCKERAKDIGKHTSSSKQVKFPSSVGTGFRTWEKDSYLKIIHMINKITLSEIRRKVTSENQQLRKTLQSQSVNKNLF